ncbi:MAG: hypothetical protein R3B06_21355 [Kofleriaceae bacterium]
MTRAIAVLSLLMLVAACKSDKSPWTSTWSEQERIAWVAACADVPTSEVVVKDYGFEDSLTYYFEPDRTKLQGGINCTVDWSSKRNRVTAVSMMIDSTYPATVAPADVARLLSVAKPTIPAAAFTTLERLATSDYTTAPAAATPGLRISAGYAASNHYWSAVIVAE